MEGVRFPSFIPDRLHERDGEECNQGNHKDMEPAFVITKLTVWQSHSRDQGKITSIFFFCVIFVSVEIHEEGEQEDYDWEINAEFKHLSLEE